MICFRVLVADPPWKFDDALPGDTRGASKNYATMTLGDIKRFKLPPMFEDSTLCLWRVAAMQREALAVVDAWDFTLKAEMIWRKLTKHKKRFFGMGRTVRMEHEVCLIATSGRPITRDNSIRSIFDAVVRAHSQKPDEFYALVQRLWEGPYCELFARDFRYGWTCYGYDVCRRVRSLLIMQHYLQQTKTITVGHHQVHYL